jgi:hypothetical protein
MAFGTPVNLGSVGSKTGTTASITLATTVNAGSLIVVTVGADNKATTDVTGADDVVGVSDSKGNTYVLAAGQTNGQGSANAGAHGSIWYSNTTVQLVSSDTITLTIGTSGNARAFFAGSYSVGAGNIAQVVGTASGVGDTGADPASVISGLTSGNYLYVGVSSDETTTGSAAYTGFTRLGIVASTGGAAASNIATSHQYAIDSASTGKTFTPATAVDAVSVLVAFREIANPNISVTVTGQAVTASIGTAKAVATPADFLCTSFTPGADRNDFSGSVGVRIWFNQNMTFEWLGARCGTDNTGLHRVAVYEWMADSLVAEGYVDFTDRTVGDYAWVKVAPFSVVSGNYYAIMKDTTASDGQWWANIGGTVFQFSSQTVGAYRPSGGALSGATPDQQYVGVDLGWDSVSTPISVNVTGQEVTASVGNASASIKISATLASQWFAAYVGTVAVTAASAQSVTLTGQELTAGIGDASVTTGTGAAGPEWNTDSDTWDSDLIPWDVVTADVTVSLTGLGLTASVGTVTASSNASVTVAGQSVTASVGTVSVVGKARPLVAGDPQTASVGTVSVTGKANVTVTGLQVAASVGTVSAVQSANVYPTGLVLNPLVSDVSVSNAGNMSVGVASPTVNAYSGILGITGKANVYITEGAPLVPWTPDLQTGLNIWLDADALGLADGAAVSPWPNPGYGPDLAVVGSPAPTVAANTLNSKPVVRFRTNEGRLRQTSTGIAYEYTLSYIVRHIVGPPGRAMSCIYPPPNFLVGFHSSGQDTMYDNGWIVSGTGWVSAPGPWKLYGADGKSPGGVLIRFFKDGTLLGSATSGAGMQGTFAISGYDASGTQETMDCEVAELVLYDNKLADADREKLEGYLSHKWGLQANLPAGHPYKASAPMEGGGGGNSLGLTASVGTVSTAVKMTAAVTGQQVAVSVGTVQVTTQQKITVASQQVAVGLGTVSVATKQAVSVTGQSVTVSLGTLSISARAGVSVTGQSVSVSAGTVSVRTVQNVNALTTVAFVSVGSVSVALVTNLYVSGQSLTASAGTVTVRGTATATLLGEQLTVEVGEVDFALGITFPVLGQEVTAYLGNVIASAGVSIEPPGFEMQVLTGDVFVAYDYVFELPYPTEAMTVHLGRAVSTNWGHRPEDDIRDENWIPVDEGGHGDWVPVPTDKHVWVKTTSPGEDWIKHPHQKHEWTHG